MKNNQKNLQFYFIAKIHEKSCHCHRMAFIFIIYLFLFWNRILPIDFHPQFSLLLILFLSFWFNSCFLPRSHELIISNIYLLSSMTKALKFFFLFFKLLNRKISMKIFIRQVSNKTWQLEIQFSFFIFLNFFFS